MRERRSNERLEVEARGAQHVKGSPNQVLTLAARAAASQLNAFSGTAPPVAARGAREGLWSE